MLFSLCEWDRSSQQSSLKEKKKKLQPPGNEDVQQTPLVDRRKIILLPLRIKLGLVKNFVRKEKRSFQEEKISGS